MSGRRDDSLLLDDMISAAERLLELAPEVPRAGEPERSVEEMVLWNLTVLGEAAKRVPSSLQTRFGDVEWRAMARTRDVVVHHYDGVDWEVIRGVLEDYVPQLLSRLIEIRDLLRRTSG